MRPHKITFIRILGMSFFPLLFTITEAKENVLYCNVLRTLTAELLSKEFLLVKQQWYDLAAYWANKIVISLEVDSSFGAISSDIAVDQQGGERSQPGRSSSLMFSCLTNLAAVWFQANNHLPLSKDLMRALVFTKSSPIESSASNRELRLHLAALLPAFKSRLGVLHSTHSFIVLLQYGPFLEVSLNHRHPPCYRSSFIPCLSLLFVWCHMFSCWHFWNQILIFSPYFCHHVAVWYCNHSVCPRSSSKFDLIILCLVSWEVPSILDVQELDRIIRSFLSRV